MESSQNQSVRLSGTGIPKPVATVKGMAKPTHCVAPMQQINSEQKKNDDLLKNNVKLLDSFNETKKPENVSNKELFKYLKIISLFKSLLL